MPKFSLFLLALIPLSLFAISAPPLPNVSSTSNFYFGGKISEVESCFCPTDPNESKKFGWKWIKYDPFWKGGTKTTKSLMYKSGLVGSSKLYANGQIAQDVWHLGKYAEDAPSCKYVTDEDWAEASAPFPHPPKCSGKYQADGSIIFTGTSGGGLTTISIPGL